MRGAPGVFDAGELREHRARRLAGGGDGNTDVLVVDEATVGALRRGFLPMLLPADFARRASFPNSFNGPLLPGLGPTCDYFGDGSLLLVLLPGHARGQIGMLAQTESGPVLFAADCCWLSRWLRPTSSTPLGTRP